MRNLSSRHGIQSNAGSEDQDQQLVNGGDREDHDYSAEQTIDSPVGAYPPVETPNNGARSEAVNSFMNRKRSKPLISSYSTAANST